jgi:hypothetical protein
MARFHPMQVGQACALRTRASILETDLEDMRRDAMISSNYMMHRQTRAEVVEADVAKVGAQRA